jgi:hypothetical protein
MLFGTRPPRRRFDYEPFFFKGPPKDLRERLRVPRDPDRHRPRRSALVWLAALGLALLMFETLFPGSIASLRRPDVEIGLNDQVTRLGKALQAPSTTAEAPKTDVEADSAAGSPAAR